ncbi:MAG: DUF6794 domain-containing protein [Bacteroidota bacterium]
MPIYLLAQNNMSKEAIQERYERNIKKERLYGVYIPSDMEEAFEELRALARPEDLNNFSSAPEDSVVVRLHFGLGRWIDHNWNLHEGSRFSHWLKQRGLTFPDDMVHVVIRSFHRHLNNKEIGLDEQIKNLILIREKAFQERQKKAKVETLNKEELDEKTLEKLKKEKE